MTYSPQRSEASSPIGYYPLGSDERYFRDKRRQMQKDAAHRQRFSEMEARDCTFHPSVTNYCELSAEMAQEMERDRVLFGGDPAERLGSASKSAAYMERMRLLREELARKEAQEMTFSPRINQHSPDSADHRQVQQQQSSPLAVTSSDKPVYDRLLEKGKMQKQRERDRNLSEERARQRELPFQPKTNRSSSVKSKKSDPEVESLPYYERLQRKLQEAERKREEEKRKRDSEYSFRPTISAVSEAVASAKVADEKMAGGHDDSTTSSALRPRDPNAIVERQYHEAIDRHNAAQLRAKVQRESETMKECFFAPAVNKKSLEITECLPEHANAGFLQRQEGFELIKEQQLEQLREMARAEAHVPTAVKPAAEVMGHVESLHMRHEITKQVKEQLRQKTTQEQCPFKPTISAGSKSLVANRTMNRSDATTGTASVVDRLYHHNRSQQQQMMNASRENNKENERKASQSENSKQRNNKQLHESTIDSTTTSPKYFDRQAFNEFLKKQELHERRKSEARLIRKRESDSEALIGCTFRPRTNSVPPEIRQERSLMNVSTGTAGARAPSPAKSVDSIRGMDTFKRNIALAQRKKEEQRMREEQLSKGKPVNGNGRTELVPFALSGSNRRPHSADGRKQRPVTQPPTLMNTRSHLKIDLNGSHCSAQAYHESKEAEYTRRHQDPLDFINSTAVSHTNVSVHSVAAQAVRAMSQPRHNGSANTSVVVDAIPMESEEEPIEDTKRVKLTFHETSTVSRDSRFSRPRSDRVLDAIRRHAKTDQSLHRRPF